MPTRYPPNMARITSNWRIVIPTNLREGLKQGDWIKITAIEKVNGVQEEEEEEEKW